MSISVVWLVCLLAVGALAAIWAGTRKARSFEVEIAHIKQRCARMAGLFAAGTALAIASLAGGFGLGAQPVNMTYFQILIAGISLVVSASGAWLLFTIWRDFVRPGIDLLENLQTPRNERAAFSGQPFTWSPVLAQLNELERTQAIFQAFFDNTPAIMFVHDVNDILIMTNRAAGTAFAMKPEDMVGCHMDQFRDPSIKKALAARGQEIMTQGASQTMEIPFPSPEGVRQGIITAFPIPGPDGVIDLLGGIAIDMTDMAEAKSERDELRRLFDAFMAEAPVTMYLKRASGEMVFISGLISKQFGVQNADVFGLGESELIGRYTDWGSEAVTAIEKLDKAVLDSQAAVAVEGVHPGTGRFEMVRRFPIFDDKGAVTHIGGVQLDIDDLVRAKDEIARSRESLYQSEKLAALGQLLAGVSHELNNPLTVVVGRSAILEEKLKDTVHAESISQLREAANRCNRIVKTFLAMARQSGPRRGAVQVNEVVEAALEITAYGLRSEGIEVSTAFDATLPLIEADEDQLIQVVTNLVLNAQHALAEQQGAGKITISSRTDRAKKQVFVEVADNGPGITDEIASRIFEPFFTTKEVGSGTGMGLSMSRGMIEEHDGSLTFVRTPGGGATFRIALPIGSPSAPDDEEVRPQAEPEVARGTVLIVDDEESVRLLLAECLAPLQLVCIEAFDGADALAKLREHRVDIVFCDIRMPRMDGVAFYKALAEAHPDLTNSIVFMSGDVLNRDAPRIAPIVHRPIIDKPFNPRDVREAAIAALGTAGNAGDLL